VCSKLRRVLLCNRLYQVFRELLQNADDHGAKNFVIDFETLHPMSNGTKPNLGSVKVCDEPKAPTTEYSFRLTRSLNGL